jgi:glucose/arabinose dehydrogenase
MKKMKFLVFIACIIPLLSSSQSSIRYVSQSIHLKKGLNFSLQVPEGYHISVAAEGLHRPRFFTRSLDGKLFVTDMYNRDDNKNGKLLLLSNWNNQSKTFDTVVTVLSQLHNPNQVGFHSIGKQAYLYVAETQQLTIRPYTLGTGSLGGAKVIATFPDYGLNYKYGGWHLTRSIDFHNDKLYVSVGSSCNACIEKEDVRATIVGMNLDGSNQQIYARGLRNSVGIKWVGNTLWATTMGRDLIGPDKPEDLLMSVKKNGYYGWPFYVQYKNKILADETFKDSTRQSFVVKPPLAEYAFKAHSAPLGFAYFTGFSDTLLNGSFMVALHGSTSVWRQRGNVVVQVKGKVYREIVTGFLQGKTEDKRYGRPCDVIQWSSNSFFISDDKNGVIYYVWK